MNWHRSLSFRSTTRSTHSIGVPLLHAQTISWWPQQSQHCSLIWSFCQWSTCNYSSNYFGSSALIPNEGCSLGSIGPMVGLVPRWHLLGGRESVASRSLPWGQGPSLGPQEDDNTTKTTPEKEAGTTIAKPGVRMAKAKRTITRPSYLKDFVWEWKSRADLAVMICWMMLSAARRHS